MHYDVQTIGEANDKKSWRLTALSVVAALLVSLFGVLPAPSANAANGREAIHVMAFPASDAIIIESNGRFGFVDSGEDSDYPKGMDPRYPWRGHIATNGADYEATLWRYLDQIGVNSSNVDFYIGTHPHSDHIGTADTVIERYKPKRIYTPEYSDEWISNPSRLWDNQYVYDQLINAAIKAEREYGASLIQHLDPAAPVVPDPSAPHTANPVFEFGDMEIEIVNYAEDYKYPGALADANLMSFGVKMTAHGKTAFLSGDIEKTDGDESRLAAEVGKVDFLKLGHHGLPTSNSEEFIEALDPEFAVQTGSYYYMFQDTIDVLNRQGVRWYPVDEIRTTGSSAVVVTMDEQSLDVSGVNNSLVYRWRNSSGPHVVAYQGGKATPQWGWKKLWGKYYWFDGKPEASENAWVRDQGRSYYLTSTGEMATGWVKVDGIWYYLEGSGALRTGGWMQQGSTWYHLAADGAMATGWRQVGGARYYFHASGAMATGWVNDGGTWYYLHSSGAMATGWQKVNGTWYYLGADGAMVTNWQQVGGARYYFHSSGAMATGWVKTDGVWRYLHSSGAMVTGWQKANGFWYYLGADGAMVNDASAVIDGRESRFATSGAWLGYA